MNFEFFEMLSQAEAEKYLRDFLDAERRGFESLATEASRDGLSVDFTLPSIAPLFEWVARRAKITPKGPDPKIPEWIRETESYSKGLFELTEESKIDTMRAAFYLGETFVTAFPPLQWRIGNPNYAQKNQPVVGPFKAGMELPVLLVAENLVRGMIEGKERNATEGAVQKWASFLE